MKFYVTTDKTQFVKMREHRDIIATKLEGHKIPETPDMLTRGSRCGPDVIPDEDMLAKHWTDGYKHTKKNEWALKIPEDEVGKYHGHVENIGGTPHTFDLSVLHNVIPWKEEEVGPAPKVISLAVGRIP
jgi:hypothetical protein